MVYNMLLWNDTTTLSIRTFSLTTLSIMTFSTKDLYETLNIMTVSIKTLSITKLCHYAECYCAECRDLFIAMLNALENVLWIAMIFKKLHKNPSYWVLWIRTQAPNVKFIHTLHLASVHISIWINIWSFFEKILKPRWG